MKGNPALPGGSLTSKPTWSNTSGCSATSAFFVSPESARIDGIQLSREAREVCGCSGPSLSLQLAPRGHPVGRVIVEAQV